MNSIFIRDSSFFHAFWIDSRLLTSAYSLGDVTQRGQIVIAIPKECVLMKNYLPKYLRIVSCRLRLPPFIKQTKHPAKL